MGRRVLKLTRDGRQIWVDEETGQPAEERRPSAASVEKLDEYDLRMLRKRKGLK